MRMSQQNPMENTELLEMLNEEIQEMLLQMCGNYAGLPTLRYRTASIFIAYDPPVSP